MGKIDDETSKEKEIVHVILMKEIEGGVSLKNLSISRSHLRFTAKLALSMGYDLMFEFSKAPSMDDAIERLAREGDGIAKMPDMDRLWLLNGEHLYSCEVGRKGRE